MVPDYRFCIAYVIVDVLCLVLTVIISGNVSRDSGSERQVRYFFLLLTSNMIFLVFDATWAILANSGLFERNEILMSVVNCVCLTGIGFAGFFWLYYCLASFESKLTDNRLLHFVLALPAMLVPVLHIIGHVTGNNIIFNPNGTISYAPIHTVIACVPLFYLLISAIVAIRRHHMATTSAQRRRCLVFILFMVAPAAAGIFDMFVADMPVAAAGIMISIAFVIMSMQRMRISSDSLTGLNNRRRADEFLEESILHVEDGQPLYLFIVDMDQFKSINDNFGHLEGDHALQLMAGVLRDVCTQINAFAARWGGDEFVVICTHGLKEPERVVSTIHESLASAAEEAHVEYELACSVGYAVCESPSETRAELLSDADAMLYQLKQNRR